MPVVSQNPRDLALVVHSTMRAFSMPTKQTTPLQQAAEAFYLDCEIWQLTPATLTWYRKYVGALSSRCVEAATTR
jgi:hypothetical protein